MHGRLATMVRFIRSACGEWEDDANDAERRDRVVAPAARSERDLFHVLLLSAVAGGGGGIVGGGLVGIDSVS